MRYNEPEYTETANAYENAGLCAMEIPNPTLAKEYFEKALQQNASLTTARLKLVEIFNNEANPRQANYHKKIYEREIKRHPRDE